MKRIVCLILTFCLLGTLTAFAADDTYSMTTSDAGRKFIKSYEGFRSTVYADSGGYAIGYGTHVNPSDYPGPITEAEADELLRGILSGMEGKLNAMARNMGITLTQNQFDALISLTYNLGYGWMNANYRIYNMLDSGIEHYSDSEIINTFARYCHIGTTVSDPLAWRRLAEAKIFLYSDYKTGGTQNYEYTIIDDPNVDTDIRFDADGGLCRCRFADIRFDDWYFKYLSPLTYLGIIEGYCDGSFQPSSAVTCGEALKLVLLASGYDRQAATGAHWASGYLTFAENNAIITQGVITDLDAPISRTLVAEIAAKALKLPAATVASLFSDTSDSHVLALFEAGIVTGSYNEAGQLVYKPNDSLMRSELCAVIWRIGDYQ